MAEAERTTSPVSRIYADNQLHDVLIASGYGVTVSVRAGHLVIVDGIGRARRERRIPRIPRSVKRLVIIGHTGYMSLESVRWLADAGIPWVQLSSDGDLIATSGPARTDSRLLRAQAYAAHEQTGLQITRDLLTAKLCGQAANLRGILRAIGAAQMIDEYADELKRSPTLDDCRTWEGQAAAIYWKVWTERVHSPFDPRDITRIPLNWLNFTSRSSLAWDGYQKNKDATDPINAMLNYLYRIAEGEAVHVCHSLGLHPSIGILHADKAGRDSMALDLIESIRPACDRLVLGMLDCGLGIPHDSHGKTAYLDRREFTETREGRCRLVPPLTHTLASYAAELGAELHPHAENAARILAGIATGMVTLPRARKVKQTGPQAPKRPARLRDGANLHDLLPDAVWANVRGFIPAAPASLSGRKGRPKDTAADREVAAALVAHELLQIPWGSIPGQISASTCRARLLEWKWAQVNGQTAWEHISEAIQAAGHLSTLVS